VSKVDVAVNIRQCHVGPENDLYGLFSMAQAITCTSLAVSRGYLDEARFVCYSMRVIVSNANIGNCGAFRWILLHFYNLSNSAACITMSFWPTADVNDAVRFVIWLHKVGLQLF